MNQNHPEQEASKGLEFQQVLSEVARQGVSDELRENRTARELLFTIHNEKFPQVHGESIKTPFGILTELVDSRKGPVEDRLLELKLDVLDFINARIKGEEKQKEYKASIESLFQTIGMGAQREYEVLTRRLENPEEPRRDLMEQRKRELQEVYGIKDRR
jgi:hypothetical protein